MVKLYNSKVIGDLLPNVKQKVKPEQAKPIVLAIEEKKPTKTKKQGFANEKDIFLYNNKMENPTENKVEGESQPTKPEKVYKKAGRKPGQKDKAKRKSRYGGKMSEKQLEILAKARAKSLEVTKQKRMAMEAEKAKAAEAATKVAANPTAKLTRVPQRSLDKSSLPSSSVPNQCLALKGVSSRTARSVSSGSIRGSNGVIRQTTKINIIKNAPTGVSLFWLRRNQNSFLEATDALISSLNPWVECMLEQIGNHVYDHVKGGHQHHPSLNQQNISCRNG